MKSRRAVCVIVVCMLVSLSVGAMEWRTSWTASMENPYPTGYPSGQPELGMVFADPQQGAVDMTFRMLVRPNIWGEKARIRFSNAFGTRPVTFDGVFVGLQQISSSIVEGTNQPVTFDGQSCVTIMPGETAWSDAIDLPYVDDVKGKYLYGRKLAVSFHVVGDTGMMTWHAEGLNISYLSGARTGSRGDDISDASFPFSTFSMFFVDAVDMLTPADTRVVVCFGDSITDGTFSTLNGDDRWPDAFSRIIRARFGNKVSVINAGISGNEVCGPDEHSAMKPYAGGPSAYNRLDRDVLTLSGVNAIIWLEGINDLRTGGKTAKQVEEGMRRVVSRIRRVQPGIRIIGATLVSSLDSTIEGYGTEKLNVERQALNAFIRTSGVFDAVVDLDSATLDRDTGKLLPEYGPQSTFGLPADWLHPNRAGLLRMAGAIDIDTVLPREGHGRR